MPPSAPSAARAALGAGLAAFAFPAPRQAGKDDCEPPDCKFKNPVPNYH